MEPENLKKPFAHTLDSVLKRHLNVEGLTRTLNHKLLQLEGFATEIADDNLRISGDATITGTQFLARLEDLDNNNSPLFYNFEKNSLILALFATHHPLVEYGLTDKEKRIKVFQILEDEIGNLNVHRAEHLIGYVGAHHSSSAKQIERITQRIEAHKQIQNELVERVSSTSSTEAK